MTAPLLAGAAFAGGASVAGSAPLLGSAAILGSTAIQGGGLAAFAALVLATAGLVVHVGLIAGAPLAAGLASNAGARVQGRPFESLAMPYRQLRARFATGSAARPVESMIAFPASAVALATVFVAAMLVPSFATGMLLAPFDDLVVVAFLLLIARLAALIAAAAGGASTAIAPMTRALSGVSLFLPAILLAVLAATLLGNARLDTIIAALPTAPRIPLALTASAIAIVAVADLECGRDLDAGLSGPPLAMLQAADAIRLLIWLDLVAVFVPPVAIADTTSGPLSWLASLALWAVRVGALALLFGAVRAALGGRHAPPRAASLLGAATLLGLLATLFVFIGQSFE